MEPYGTLRKKLHAATDTLYILLVSMPHNSGGTKQHKVKTSVLDHRIGTVRLSCTQSLGKLLHSALCLKHHLYSLYICKYVIYSIHQFECYRQLSQAANILPISSSLITFIFSHMQICGAFALISLNDIHCWESLIVFIHRSECYQQLSTEYVFLYVLSIVFTCANVEISEMLSTVFDSASLKLAIHMCESARPFQIIIIIFQSSV